MKNIFILIMLIGGLSISALAQYSGFALTQYDVLPQNLDWSKSSLIQDETVQLKNPNKAMWMSVGSTIGTYVLFGVAVAFENPNPVVLSILSLSHLASPAMGYLYTDNWDDFWNSVSRRFLGRIVMGTGSLIILLESLDHIWDSENPNGLVIAAGLGLVIGGAIYNLRITFNDFKQVRTRVHEYNEGLVKSVQIMPAIDPVTKSVGVGFRVNF